MRLCNCLKHTFPDQKIEFTAHIGLDFAHLQTTLCNRVHLPESFIFRRAPDILIEETKHITSDTCTANNSSDEELAVEQSFQRHPLKSDLESNLPEKLGELIAASYFCWLCSIFRRLCNQRAMTEVTINGLLIDKMIGTIHCKLTGNVSGPENALRSIQVKVYDAAGKSLTPEALCYHLKLLNNFLL